MKNKWDKPRKKRTHSFVDIGGGAKLGDKEGKMNSNRFVRIYMKLVGIAITHNLKQFLHDKKGDKNH